MTPSKTRPARKWILIPEYAPLFAMAKCFGPQHGPLREPCPTPIPIIGELLRQSGREKLTIMEVKMNPDRSTTDPVELTLSNYTLPYDEIVNGIKQEAGATLEPVSMSQEGVAPTMGDPGQQAPGADVPSAITANNEDTGDKKDDEPVADTAPMTEPEPEPAPAEENMEANNGDEDKPEAEESSDENTNPAAEEADSDKDGEDAEQPNDEAEDDEPAPATAGTETALPPEPTVTVTTRPGVEIEGIEPKIKPYDQMTKKERKEARRKAAEAANAAGNQAQ